MKQLNTPMVLSSKLELYSDLKLVFAITFVMFFLLTIIYGIKIKALEILGKKTGLSKKKEIALMKAGKAIKRKNIQKRVSEQYTVPISYSNENLMETERLAETVALGATEIEETIVLNQEMLQTETDGFYLQKNIVVAHGKRLAL